MSDLKLRRLVEHNQRLREDLARPRMKISEASARYVSVAIVSAVDADRRHTNCQPDSILQNNERPPGTSYNS